MIFTPEITFFGMYLFVPPGESDVLTALVPVTQDRHAHRITLRGPGIATPIDLAGCDLTFPGLIAGDESTLEHVADLSRLTPPRHVERFQLGPMPDREVTARITLPRWAATRAKVPGVWTFSGRDQLLTNRLTFDLPPVDLDELTAVVQKRDGSPPVTYSMRPGAPGRLRIEIRHDPVEKPTEPNLGQPAPHFEHHYMLCDDPGAVGEIPVLKVKLEDSDPVGSLFTCLAAQAPPGP